EMGPLTWKSGRAPLTSNAPPSIVASTAVPDSGGGSVVVGGVVVVDVGCSSASSVPTTGASNGRTADAGPSVVVVESAGTVDDETSFEVVPTRDDGAASLTRSTDLALPPSSAGPATAAGGRSGVFAVSYTWYAA